MPTITFNKKRACFDFLFAVGSCARSVADSVADDNASMAGVREDCNRISNLMELLLIVSSASHGKCPIQISVPDELNEAFESAWDMQRVMADGSMQDGDFFDRVVGATVSEA